MDQATKLKINGEVQDTYNCFNLPADRLGYANYGWGWGCVYSVLHIKEDRDINTTHLEIRS